MSFIRFAQDWITENVENDSIATFLRDVCELINSWNLSGKERSLYTFFLFQLLRAYNEAQNYED